MKGLVRLAFLGALVAGIVKMMSMKRHFMEGTEEELRDRVRDKFADRVPPEKLSEVESKVIEFARRRGTLVETPEPAPGS